MSVEDRKVEASRKRWSRLSNPRAIFKPLKMAVHKFEKAETEDPIGIKFRKEFGMVEEFVRNADPKHLHHDSNNDYFAVVVPKHVPIHLRTPYLNHRQPSTHVPVNKSIDRHDTKYSNRRSLENNEQAQRVHHKPLVNNHQRASLPMANPQNPVTNLRGRPQEHKRMPSESNNETFKNSNDVSTKTDLNLKVTKFAEDLAFPIMMSPLPHKASTPPPKIMTKLQQIELSDNPLDFSVSEDELNPEGDDSEGSDVPSGGFLDDAKESDCASEVKEDVAKLSSPINSRLLSAPHKSLLNEVSLEDGEIDESDFMKENLRSSSRVRQPSKQLKSVDDISTSNGTNAFLKDNFQGTKVYEDDPRDIDNEKAEGMTYFTDLEDGEIEDAAKQSFMSSSPSSNASSNGSPSSSDDSSEFSPMHSKPDNKNIGAEKPVNPSDKFPKINKILDEKETTPIVEESHVNLLGKNSESSLNISKLSAFEPPLKKSSTSSKTSITDKVKVDAVNKFKMEEQHKQQSPAANEKKDVVSNAVTQKPKQVKPLRTSKGKPVSDKLKIRNVDGNIGAIEDIKQKAEVEQLETSSKNSERSNVEKKDQRPDAKVNNKKPVEQRFAEVVNNQQGISFVSAIQSSKVVPPIQSTKVVPAIQPTKVAKKKIVKEDTTKEKKEAKLDVKSRKRKCEDLEKDNNDKLSEASKRQKILPKSNDVPLVLRFDTSYFQKLEKMKRKNEDEIQPASKKLKMEQDPMSKDKLTDLKRKRIIRKPAEKPTNQSINNKSKKPKQNAEEIEPMIEDFEKKQKMQEVSRKDSDVPVNQGELSIRKNSKKPNKLSSKKEDEKIDQVTNKLKSNEEILRRANEALGRGISKGKESSNNKKSLEHNVGNQLFESNNDEATSSKPNSPKQKKEILKTKPGSSVTPSKSEQQVFRGTFRVTAAPDPESYLTDDMKEKQTKPSSAQNENQSQESIRRSAEEHLNRSQLLQKMSKVIQNGNGGRTSFGSLLNSIDSHVHSFLGAVELSKLNEDSFNIRHYNQLIENVETSIKELEGSIDKNRLNFLLQSFKVMVNDYYFWATFNKDKDINEAAMKEIQMMDHKNSPRSSPDSTCTSNPSTVAQKDTNTTQQSAAGNVDASAVKVVNQAKNNLSFLFPYLFSYNSCLKVLFKLASEPSCQDLCDRQSLPVDMIHGDLHMWTKWFEDTVSRVKTMYQLG